ncbi:trimethylamine methyltransferase family protein [Ostreibacterium oceani]|nr:trimethylamine methyltransferase family protein [Ostreibacterium oceani]
MARRKRNQDNAATQPTQYDPLAGIACKIYNPLQPNDLARIVDAAKTVLQQTGIEVGESHCRDVFVNAGCRLDVDKNRIFIEPELVDKCLALASNRVILGGRDGDHFDLDLSGAKVYLGTGGAAVNIIDTDGKVRETTLADNYHIGRLCDTLQHIHFYMRPVVSRDLTNEQIDINQTYACLAATKKHVMTNCYDPSNVQKIRQMGEMLAGSAEAFDKKPPISMVAAITVSPLRYAMETVEVLDEAIKYDIPIVTSSAPQAGATAPASLAGTLVQIIAEQLSGIVYVNLQKPGFPLIIGCVPAQADLRTGAFVGGSAEFALLNAACGQLARYLDLPIYNSAGIADAKTPDAQLGSEKTMTTLLAAMSGSNYIHHSAGFLDSLMTVAYTQYVIDNDSNGQVMRALRGIDMSDEALAVQVIHDVCNGENHFLGHPHTLSLMHSEYDYPKLYDRKSRNDWKDDGSLDINARAKIYADDILAHHFPQVIPEEIDNQIREAFEILLPKSEMQPKS